MEALLGIMGNIPQGLSTLFFIFCEHSPKKRYTVEFVHSKVQGTLDLISL